MFILCKVKQSRVFFPLPDDRSYEIVLLRTLVCEPRKFGSIRKNGPQYIIPFDLIPWYLLKTLQKQYCGTPFIALGGGVGMQASNYIKLNEKLR